MIMNLIKIRAKSKKRDEVNLSNYFFCITSDTYNDNENAVFFTTTPEALRTDAQIFNDGQATSGLPLAYQMLPDHH